MKKNQNDIRDVKADVTSGEDLLEEPVTLLFPVSVQALDAPLFRRTEASVN